MRDLQDQLEVFRRNAVDLLPEEELVAKLRRKGRLRIKYGADPTRPDLHLGHYVCLKKLRDLQELGHEIVFIVGDFTAQIGDPSGRSSTRPRLSPDEVVENARTYFEQVFQVLDPGKTEIMYNSQWLEGLSLRQVIELAATYTVARMLERDDFSKRYREGVPIYIHEFLYPLLQGYDSFEIGADVEVGGTDQTFNFLVAREIQKALGQEPQVILTLPLLVGTDGKLKMSKSYDNTINLKDPPFEMYGKVMSIPDAVVLDYYRLVLYTPPDEMEEVAREMERNPRDTKARLARRIVALFHGEAAAREAEEEFIRVFRERQGPQDAPVVTVPPEGVGLVDLLSREFGISRSEARRLIRQGSVRLGGEKLLDERAVIRVEEEVVMRVGKHRFLRLRPETGSGS